MSIRQDNQGANEFVSNLVAQIRAYDTVLLGGEADGEESLLTTLERISNELMALRERILNASVGGTNG